VTANPPATGGGNTSFSFTLTGGGGGCHDISYVALPVCFNPKKSPEGLVLATTQPAHFDFNPQFSPSSKRVKWDAAGAGPGPFNATFTFTLAGTGIPTETVQAQTHAGGGSDPVSSGAVAVPKPASCG